MASHGPSVFGNSRANSSSESPQARASGMPRTTASASSSRLNVGRAGFALASVGVPAFGAPFALGIVGAVGAVAGEVAFFFGCLAACLAAGVPVWAAACTGHGSNGSLATRKAPRVRPATTTLPAVLRNARMVVSPFPM